MKPTPVKNRVKSQPFVVGGCIIEKDNKFLLVQEKSKHVYGLWNQPAGWVDMGESIVAGAKREAQEETGLNLRIKGLIGVYSLVKTKDTMPIIHAVKFIFAAIPLTDKLNFSPDELLDARWFSFEEITALGDSLRDDDIIQEIQDYKDGKCYPVSSVDTFTIMTH